MIAEAVSFGIPMPRNHLGRRRDQLLNLSLGGGHRQFGQFSAAYPAHLRMGISPSTVWTPTNVIDLKAHEAMCQLMFHRPDVTAFARRKLQMLQQDLYGFLRLLVMLNFAVGIFPKSGPQAARRPAADEDAPRIVVNAYRHMANYRDVAFAIRTTSGQFIGQTLGMGRTVP